MQPRQLGIIAIAAIVAFGAAFGIGKATSKTEAASPSGGSVKALEVAEAPSVGTLTTSAAPSLKAIKAKKKAKPKKAASKPSTSTSASSGSTTTTARPQTTTARPVVKPVVKPVAKPKPKPQPSGGGVSGGGED